jgi:hypothetical protein
MRNLFIGSFINLFIFNVIIIVSISFVFNNHVIHNYARFYNEKVGGRDNGMNEYHIVLVLTFFNILLVIE